MGHSQGKPYVWRRALARMTDAREELVPTSAGMLSPRFPQQQNGQHKTQLSKYPARASRKAFSGHVSDHYRVVLLWPNAQLRDGLSHTFLGSDSVTRSSVNLRTIPFHEYLTLQHEHTISSSGRVFHHEDTEPPSPLGLQFHEPPD
jgi:hypothetical protein